MRAVVPADRKAPERCTGCVGSAYRTLILFDVGGRTELPVRPDGEYYHTPTSVVSYQQVLTRRVDAQMSRASPLRADGVEQRQTPIGTINPESTHRARARVLKSSGLISRVQVGPGRIEREPGWVGTTREELALRQGPA